jgi:phospholipid/cholesterol/gamma-HCH transport system substrate-binding protein
VNNILSLEAGGDDVNLKAGDLIVHTQDAVVLEKLISQFLYNSAGDDDDKDKD